MKKEYVSKRWPNLHLPGIGVKFQAGVFATSDENLQAGIERQKDFGRNIVEAGAASRRAAQAVPIDAPAGVPEGAELGVKKGKIVKGTLGTGDIS